ncbi:hypothetical protein ACF07S_22070 [Streptomyces sp. NPDC016640]|uniref:hypothetical protein n=1 Tax=Streptomyces sp. NPDC016640 TaxID=3364969 RepID=UPI0036F52810
MTGAVDLAAASRERGRAEAADRGLGGVRRRLRRGVLDAVGMLPDDNDSASARARDGVASPFELP